MRPTTLEEFFALCEVEHDSTCFFGAKCRDRTEHIELAYLSERMADAIDAERARVRELEAVVERVRELAAGYDAWDGSRDSEWSSSPRDRERLHAAIEGNRA